MMKVLYFDFAYSASDKIYLCESLENPCLEMRRYHNFLRTSGYVLSKRRLSYHDSSARHRVSVLNNCHGGSNGGGDDGDGALNLLKTTILNRMKTFRRENDYLHGDVPLYFVCSDCAHYVLN